MEQPALRIAISDRPFPGYDVNGDEALVVERDGQVLFALIDGVGHGALAAEATAVAREYLEAHALEPGPEILKGCHHVLRGTRGAVISLVQFAERERSLMFTGIGNVEGRLYQNGRREAFVPARGILGVNIPRPRMYTFAAQGAWALMLHSDGVSARMDIDGRLSPDTTDLQELADEMVARFGRETDDATVLLATYQPPSARERSEGQS